MLCLCYYKNEPLMVNFKFSKFYCYQQIRSFLITPYNGIMGVFFLFDETTKYLVCFVSSFYLSFPEERQIF
jgi:hypothetical protein